MYERTNLRIATETRPARNIHNCCKIARSVDNGTFVRAYCSKGLEGTIDGSLIEHAALHSRGWIPRKGCSPLGYFILEIARSFGCAGRGKRPKIIYMAWLQTQSLDPSFRGKKWTSDGYRDESRTSFEELLQDIREPLINKRRLDYYSLWYSVVHAHSKCNLTKGNILIALSGVVNRPRFGFYSQLPNEAY
jgi:hypothetical protein